jgi:general secretion pathway protein G
MIRGLTKTRHHRGFSLLELLAVVTILCIIALIVIPRISVCRTADKQQVEARHKSEIDAAVERWYFEKGTWPADDLSDIGHDNVYFPRGLPTNPTTGANYTLDSTTHRVH